MNFPWKSGNMESVGKKSDTKIWILFIN
jgi:hypothetical protein